VPGDAGFDPLGFCQDVQQFVDYREAELKHGRMAMIAALVFPLAEFGDQLLSESELADFTGVPDLLADTGGMMSPTGGVQYGNGFIQGFIVLTVLVGSIFELTARRRGTQPGDVGFDPAELKNWAPSPFQSSFIPRNRDWMSEAEVQHCRLAMMAIVYDVVDEALTGNPVVEDTENFFDSLDRQVLSLNLWGQLGDSVPTEMLEFPATI